jgi:hypothetical protein
VDIDRTKYQITFGPKVRKGRLVSTQNSTICQLVAGERFDLCIEHPLILRIVRRAYLIVRADKIAAPLGPNEYGPATAFGLGMVGGRIAVARLRCVGP